MHTLYVQQGAKNTKQRITSSRARRVGLEGEEKGSGGKYQVCDIPMFRQEIAIMKEMDHPHIIKLYEVAKREAGRKERKDFPLRGV